MFDVYTSSMKTNDIMKNAVNNFKDSLQEFNPNAFYMAIVVNTNDEYKLGRIQIRIPAIHGSDSSQSYYLSDNNLPWARPALWNGAGHDMGTFIIPAKGTRVFVTFEYNEATRPIYFGGVLTTFKTNPKEFNDNELIFKGRTVTEYSDDRNRDLEDYSSAAVIYKSLKGSTIIIDDSDANENISIIDSSGQMIKMVNESQSTNDRRYASTTPRKGANIYIKTNGKLELDCDDLHLDANTTNLDDYVSGGGSSGSDKSYVYSQLSAADTWNINHNLNKFPSVTIIDSSDEEVFGEIKYIDKNNITLVFSDEFSGKAYLN